MERETAFNMGASNIRFGAGATREIGMERRPECGQRVVVVARGIEWADSERSHGSDDTRRRGAPSTPARPVRRGGCYGTGPARLPLRCRAISAMTIRPDQS